jgi:hypothetical protein
MVSVRKDIHADTRSLDNLPDYGRHTLRYDLTSARNKNLYKTIAEAETSSHDVLGGD